MSYVIKINGEVIDHAETRAAARRARDAIIYGGVGTDDNTTIDERRTRVVRSVADGNRWQAQYRDTHMKQWFDIGDAKDTEAEARDNAREFQTGTK